MASHRAPCSMRILGRGRAQRERLWPPVKAVAVACSLVAPAGRVRSACFCLERGLAKRLGNFFLGRSPYLFGGGPGWLPCVASCACRRESRHQQPCYFA
uniref:Predicted protein n=1 Tax=Hordeum vulgare subsp. vulgare TaxID=112509 RepID=F2EKQ9_HORVV|nr:predicted protein [Hordeum vulgare subsp. vulgare]